MHRLLKHVYRGSTALAAASALAAAPAWADNRLVDLPAAGALSGPEVLYGVQNGSDAKVTASQLLNFMQGGLNVGTFNTAINLRAAALATGALAAQRTMASKISDGCISLNDIAAPSTMSVGPANAVRLNGAIKQAQATGKGCVNIEPPVDSSGNPTGGPIITDPVSLPGNIAINCIAPGKVTDPGTVKFQPTAASGDVFDITNVAGVSIRRCGFVSGTAQTAGSYLSIQGSNTILCDECYMDRGYVSTFVKNSGGVYFVRPIIRNSQFRAMWFTGTSDDPNGGAHDVFIDTPQIDIDSATAAPNVDAGIYIDFSGGAIFTVGGDVLHHHNNYWINPGAGQFVIWEMTVGTDFDYADFDTNLRGGSSIAITPNNGGIANGNRFVNVWASTATPGVKVVGDATSTCAANSFVDLQALHNRGQAFLTDYCENTVLAFPAISNASITSPGTYSAVEVGAHTNSMQLVGGSIGSQGSTSPATQKFNLQIDSGFIGRFTCTGTNLIAANTTGPHLGPFYADLVASHPAVGSGAVNCPGINPQGIATVTPSASPFVYQAGYTAETLNLVGGTVSSVTITDGNGNTTPWAVSTNVSVPLAPAQTATITYSSAPTIRTQRQ